MAIIWLIYPCAAIKGLIGSWVSDDLADVLLLKSDLIIGVRATPANAFVLHGHNAFGFSVVVLVSLYLVFGLNKLIVRIVLVEMDDHG